MNERTSLEQELREAFDRAPWNGPGDDVDIDGTWVAGRRRRTRKRTGALVLAGAAALAVGTTVWASGLMGGSRGPGTTVAAVIPEGMTTFVFAAPDAPDVDPATISAMTVPRPEDLHGTTWELQDALWAGEGSAHEALGTDLSTVLNFQSTHWGVLTDRCGAFLFEDLTIAEDGRFEAHGASDADEGCAPEAQAAEDLWEESLSAGGYLRELGNGGWLLLSVELPVPDAVAPTGPAVTTDAVTASAAPPSTTTVPTTTVPKTTPPPTTPAARTDPPTDEPTTDGPAAEPPSGFTAPEEAVAHPDLDTFVLDESTPQVNVTSIRFGRHDGYDRVVLDLSLADTAAGQPHWRVRWENPAMGQAGAPDEIDGPIALVVDLVGVPYPEDFSKPWSMPTDTVPAGSVITRVQAAGPFEAHLEVFIEADRERPFRVTYMENPSRLVIDVQH